MSERPKTIDTISPEDVDNFEKHIVWKGMVELLTEWQRLRAAKILGGNIEVDESPDFLRGEISMAAMTKVMPALLRAHSSDELDAALDEVVGTTPEEMANSLFDNDS